MKILFFGEILWDVYPNKSYIGGAPLNFAAHLSRHGEEVYMLSSLGRDELGKAALDVLSKWNIKTDYVSVLNDKQTGKCLVTLDEKQIPSYNLLYGVAYDYIDCNKINNSFDVLYFGTMALRSEYNFSSLKTLIKNNSFTEIFVDVNIRPPHFSTESLSFAAENATILKISLEELSIVAENLNIKAYDDYKYFARLLKEKYKKLKCVIITLGGDGAFAIDYANNKECACACEEVKVKSTVGAGDSFSAAFLHKYLKDESLENSLSYASKIASFVVSRFDAVPDYRVQDFI